RPFGGGCRRSSTPARSLPTAKNAAWQAPSRASHHPASPGCGSLALRRADHLVVEDVADAHLAGADIGAEDAAFALMPRGDQNIVARRLRSRPLPGRETGGEADAALLELELAGADL